MRLYSSSESANVLCWVSVPGAPRIAPAALPEPLQVALARRKTRNYGHLREVMERIIFVTLAQVPEPACYG
jgi:hypothetical protein